MRRYILSGAALGFYLVGVAVQRIGYVIALAGRVCEDAAKEKP